MLIPNVIVDTSYTVYFTAFSTWNWYKKEFKPTIDEDNLIDPMKDPEFKSMFKNRYNWNLQRALKKVCPLQDKKRMYFAMDGRRKDLWRNEIFPQYKISRATKKNEFNLSGTFDYVRHTLLPELADRTGCKILDVKGVEGDDIIATLILKKFKNESNVIITCDHDIIQLKDYATIVNLKGEELTTDWDSESFLLHKILMGDNSDEIPSVFPRCGPKTAEKYINNNDKLLEKLGEDPLYVENLQRNTDLMDLRRIPDVITESILDALKQVDETVTFNEL